MLISVFLVFDWQVTFEAPPTVVDEAPVKGEETPAEGEEPETELKAELGTSSAHQEEQTTEERLQLLVRVRWSQTLSWMKNAFAKTDKSISNHFYKFLGNCAKYNTIIKYKKIKIQILIQNRTIHCIKSTLFPSL